MQQHPILIKKPVSYMQPSVISSTREIQKRQKGGHVHTSSQYGPIIFRVLAAIHMTMMLSNQKASPTLDTAHLSTLILMTKYHLFIFPPLFYFVVTLCKCYLQLTNKEPLAVHYTVIKRKMHLRTQGKCRNTSCR